MSISLQGVTILTTALQVTLPYSWVGNYRSFHIQGKLIM